MEAAIPIRRRRDVLLLEMAPLALLGAVAVIAAVRLHQFSRTLEAMDERTQAMAAQLQTLSGQASTLRSDVDDLRGTLSDRTTDEVLFLKIMVLRPDVDVDLARTIAKNVRRYSALYGKDPNLVLAIMYVESGFNPHAVSSAGAVGLMQVMPHWKRILGINGELNDPETSIRYGLQILGFYEQMYRDQETVLTAYNRGPGPVDHALMHGLSPRNDYAPRVMQAYERIRRLHVDPGT